MTRRLDFDRAAQLQRDFTVMALNVISIREQARTFEVQNGAAIVRGADDTLLAVMPPADLWRMAADWQWGFN